MARPITAFLSLFPGESGVAVNSCGKLNERDGAVETFNQADAGAAQIPTLLHRATSYCARRSLNLCAFR
jgi:hypothetical protein